MKGLGALILCSILALALYPVRVHAVVNRCLDVEDAVDSATKKMQSAYDDHLAKYEAVSEHLLQLGSDLSVAGKPVETFEKNRKEFDKKVATFSTNFKSFDKAATDAREAVCNDSESELKSRLETTRAELVKLRQSAEAVHGYYQGTVISHLKTLK